jgi:5-methylcytosine-specific restriction endonuclease McrA
MGLEIISQWLEPGDDFLIANIGHELFAARNLSTVREFSDPHEDVVQEILSRLSDDIVRERAMAAPQYPQRQTVSRHVFLRNEFVVRAALNRASDTCEMPDCDSSPFCKDDGSTYLEVHHIVPLSEGGLDSLENVAALCPNCHREQHHGIDRAEKRQALREAILALES